MEPYFEAFHAHLLKVRELADGSRSQPAEQAPCRPDHAIDEERVYWDDSSLQLPADGDAVKSF